MTQTTDPAMTSDGSVITVALESIEADVSAWPRQDLDRARVAEFAELYRDDARTVLPPLDVVPDPDTGRYILADGWHRFHALHQVEATEADVRIIPAGDGESPLAAAYRHGLTLAATAGLPLTRTERVAAVKRLLDEHPDWSDRQIGRTCGVSHNTVSKYRRGEAVSLTTTSDPDTNSGTGDGAEEGEYDSGSSYHVPTASDAARTLVRGLVRLDERRGLLARFSDKRAVRSMGTALAEALADEYDERENALSHARSWSRWIEHAITILEESSPE